MAMLEVSDEELKSLVNSINLRYGMDFENYEPISFKRRVARVIDRFKLENSLGLWRKFMSDKEFIYTFIDEITVGLTEMFRNPDFWIKLREEYLPKFRNQTELSIWHAGCSTGEEVYSMGIMLTEEHFMHKTRIWATDLNSQSIRNTEEGNFSTYYEKNYNTNYIASKGKKLSLDAYYTVDNEQMKFSNKVRFNNIKFQQHNLVKDDINQKFDIIFCRNVMIYFDETLKMKLLEKFYNSLNDGGLFIIGYYDAMPRDYKKFFDNFDAQTKTYSKVKA